MSWTKSSYEEDNASPDSKSKLNRSGDEVTVPFRENLIRSLESPAWLSQEAAQSANPQTSSSSTAQSNASLNSTSSPIPEELDAAVPRIIFYTRMINLILSVCMILASLLSLLTTDNATTGVLACYVMIFACLLCAFETHLKQITKVIALNFGFLYSAKSRGVFMIFIGTIMFSFSLFGKLVGAAMLANAFFNIFIILKYPQFEDAQRNDAQKEIKEYLASNPAFAKQAMRAGAVLLSSNSDMDKRKDGGYSQV